jgi:diguanylate cyclase (GGDEF)-like protein/PAS domain S-box-containing protein
MEGSGPQSMRGKGEHNFDLWLAGPDTLLEGLPDAVVASRRDGRIVLVNHLAEELFGYTREELIGQPVTVLWPEPVRERYVQNMELYFATEHPLRFSAEATGLRRDGTEFVGEMSWGIVETTGGPLLLAIGRDISDRRASEARLQAVATMAERALSDPDPRHLAVEAVQALSTTLPLAGVEVRLAHAGPVAASRATTGLLDASAPAALCILLGSGAELTVNPSRPLSEEEMNTVRAVAHVLGTALARLRAEERMRHDALHDPWTGLANRSLLRDRLEHALARSDREGVTTGVVYLDLDNFKQINDVYGHATGDSVLVEVARRLQAAVRPSDTVARLGGDEFVAVCESVSADTVLALAQRLTEGIAVPILAGGARHELSASIGIALGETTAQALLSEADAAVYRAKAQGGGCIEASR